MRMLTFKGCEINRWNCLIFKTGIKIIDGNYIRITTSNVCDGKSRSSKYSFYKQHQKIPEKEKLVIEAIPIKNKELRIYPNPNQGDFFIDGFEELQEKNIQIFNSFEKKLLYSLSDNRITILNKYQGIILLRILKEDKYKTFKIVIDKLEK